MNKVSSNSSKLRKRILNLDEKPLDILLQEALRPLPMIVGTPYQVRRRYGNPRCRYARGELHVSWYLSRRKEGGTRLNHIGRIVPEWPREQVLRYQHHQKALSSICKIDSEIYDGLKNLRDEKLCDYDQVKKGRR